MLWDIFCRVIDNYGDIGVSWRLCADLAARGEHVRLWVDDASPLQWMAPGALQGQWPGVQVLAWDKASDSAVLWQLPSADVWIETFGCELPAPFMAHFVQMVQDATARQPVWINLEYLSAEPYVERSHGLRSPVMQGPAKGWYKTFFYPGFTARTGGLLHGPGLMQQTQEPATTELRVSLFCYEPPLLQRLLDQLAASATPVHLLVTAGRATEAVQSLLEAQSACGALRISYLQAMPQTEFDRLLCSCDLNFVRGEDSVVRALWAGKPFVWHIYPQHDQAHAAKLEAFMAQMQLSDAVCALHRAWNGLLPASECSQALLSLKEEALPDWQQQVQTARARLLQLADLGSALLHFAEKNR